MLRVLHEVIARRIASELRFSENNAQIFVSGSLGPDSHADFPHAVGKEKKILYKIETARIRFLENDEYCYGEVANALHYIQDKWCNDQKLEEGQAALLHDELLLESICQLASSEETKEYYLSTVKSLVKIKTMGIESWFNHSWGFWHKDFASCVYVFADILELMLPTINPEITSNYSRERLAAHVESEAFEKSVKAGFIFSLKNNFVNPKLSGYPASIYALASINPPSGFRDFVTDFNIAYRLSLEIARYTLQSADKFKFTDSWTHRSEDRNKEFNLAYVMPSYHVLITRPVLEVHEERTAKLEQEQRNFLSEWTVTEAQLASKARSEIWSILLNGLVELLRKNTS